MAISFNHCYVTLCQRMGVAPVAPDRAAELAKTWDAMLGAESAMLAAPTILTERLQ